jgi:hypothetical protein
LRVWLSRRRAGDTFVPVEQPRVTVTEIALQESGDGSREWCFTVCEPDQPVRAARFPTRREAERAHQRFTRALELLSEQPPLRRL